jgi:hypothetical protein
MRAGAFIQIAVFGAAWLTASAPTAAQSGGAGSHPPAAEATKNVFSFDLLIQERYDDNILELSQRDIDRVESGNFTPGRFLISTPDDFITNLAGRVRWTGKPWTRRETRIALAAEANWYAQNDVKNYQSYGISIAQELTASKKHLSQLRLSVTNMPEFYDRQLTDDDASVAAQHRIREPSRFRETNYWLAYDQDFIADRFDGRLALDHRRRNYNEFFPERDNSRNTVAVTLGGRPFKSYRFGLQGTAGLGRLQARAELDFTDIPDDDISYDWTLFGFSTAVPWPGGRSGHFEAEINYEKRTYTTDNKFDLTRYGRHDDRLTWRAGIVQRLPADLELVAYYERETNDAHWPLFAIPSDDTTDFTAARFSVALRWRTSVGK